MNVYESCPTFLSPRFNLRLIRREDAPGLLEVYSERAAQKYFNSDDCLSDYRFATLWEMENCIDTWLKAYQAGEYVRWTVLRLGCPVGTVEMSRRDEGLDGKGCGLLRMDLMSMYEFSDVHDELLRTILPEMHRLFSCARILTKALPVMEKRRLALVLHGFIPSQRPMIGWDGIEYGGYWGRRHNLD